MSDMLRITGMISGMDTDSTVKKLVQTEQLKIDKAKQEKQYLEWQKEDYREVANILRSFQSDYFDVLNTNSNMRSSNTYNMFSGAASINGVSSQAVSIKATSSSIEGSFTIDTVTQLATKDRYTSGSEVIGDITSSPMNDIASINTALATNASLSFAFDGVSKTISLNEAGYGSYADFATDLSSKLQEVFTNVDIIAEITGNEMSFKINALGELNAEAGHTLTVNATNSDLLSEIGLTVGQSNTVNVKGTLESVFGVTTDQSLTINGKDFSFSKETSINQMMSEINSSGINVSVSFDPFTDMFQLESSQAGSDKKINITDTDGLFGLMKLQGGSEVYAAAQNAEFQVNGVVTSRSSNTFEINGTQVTLNEIPTSPVEVNITSDPTEVKDKIIKFVESYNEMIEKISDMTSSRRDYDFAPLTDEQKESMTDEDIEKWQEQARQGTLNGDRNLTNVLSKMRQALYESVDGLGINLSDIGITSSNNYQERGKLIIDDDKLNQALKDRPNEVIELFTKESDYDYLDSNNMGDRYKQNGIVERLHDLLQDNIRLTRSENGQRGYLIVKAGLDTGTDTTSEMAKKLSTMDERIDDLLEMLADQEDKYYAQFAAMESAMSSLASQGEWLASQFGG